MGNNKLTGRSLIGIVFLLIGLALILRSFDVMDSEVMDFLFSWPTLLVVLGILFLSSHRQSNTGWILLIIGGLFLIKRITDVSVFDHDIFWPVLFIAIGVLILFKSLGKINKQGAQKVGDKSNTIDDIALLGGNERKITADSFKGGTITSILGGSKINFKDATMAPGENVIDVFMLFGGSTFIVPRDWNVKSEVTSIFGGFDDKRDFTEQKQGKSESTLIIKGIALFGGGEVKSY